MATQNTQVRIICARLPVNCGFNVDTSYFMNKKRFAPGICPNCNSPIKFVNAVNHAPVDYAMIMTGPNAGMVVPSQQAALMASVPESEA